MASKRLQGRLADPTTSRGTDRRYGHTCGELELYMVSACTDVEVYWVMKLQGGGLCYVGAAGRRRKSVGNGRPIWTGGSMVKGVYSLQLEG